MKKQFVTFLLVLILALGMTGCSSDKDDSEVQKVSKEDKKSEDKEDTDNKKDANKEEDSAKKDEDNKTDGKTSIEEQVLMDKDSFKVTALSFVDDDNSFMGPEMYFRFENNSDANVSFSMIDASVNGLMIEPTLFAEVAAGKQKEDYAILNNYFLEELGVDVIASIEFKFNISNSDTYETILVSDMITIDTSAKDTFVQKYNDAGEVIFDSENIKIVSQGLTNDEINGPQIRLYIENNSNTIISLDVKDLSVNGNMADIYFSAYVLPGKKAVESISFADLAANGIDEIDNAEFYIDIYDPATWDTIVTTDTISLSLK